MSSLGHGLYLGSKTMQQGSNVNQELPFQDDLSFHAVSRSGLTIVDNKGTDAILLLPVLNAESKYFHVADSSGLNILNDDFTFSCWINGAGTSFAYLAGMHVGGGAGIGRYGFYQNTSTGYLAFIAQSSGGTINIISTISSTGWHHCFMDINQTTKAARFFIDNVQIGTDTSFTGSFTALSPLIKFVLNGAANSSGVFTPANIIGQYSDVLIYRRILTTEERTKLFNRESVTGTELNIPCVAGDFINILDISGNGHHIVNTWNNLNYFTYSAYGSRVMLERKSFIYEKSGNRKIWIPCSEIGVELTGIPMISGYIKTKELTAPPSDKIPFIDAMVSFTGSEWDRSLTANYLANARILFLLAKFPETNQSRYRPNLTKSFHLAELNNFFLNNIKEEDKQGVNFVSALGGTSGNPDYISEIISYNTNKTGADAIKVINYCGDISKWARQTHTFSKDGYYICAARGSKAVAHNGSNLLYYSEDAGVTWMRSLNVGVNLPIITFAYIFESGHILLCNETKAYYSIDNLLTYQESTVLGIDGNTFVPPTSNAFRPFISIDSVSIGDKEVLVWGNYSIVSGVAYTNINVFYTIDGGQTIKSCYKANVTLTPSTAYPARHIHGINFNPNDNTFWLQTGDATNECNWIKGTYDNDLDTWIWNRVIGGNDGDFWKTSGMAFVGDYVYWGSDITNDLSRCGIWRVKYADIMDTAKYERVFISMQECWGFHYLNGYYVAMFRLQSTGARVAISKDGVHFVVSDITDLEGINTYFYLLNGRFDSLPGKLYLDYIQSGQTLDAYTAGKKVIMNLI